MALLCRRSETICANLVEGIKKNNSVNFEFGPVVQEEILLKILSGALAALLFSGADHLCNLTDQLCNLHRGHYEEQFCIFISNFGQWFRRYRCKKSYLELWRPSCSVEWNHSCNFEIGHHGEHSCEVL